MSVRFVRPVSTSAYVSRYVGLIAFVLLVVTFVLHRIGMLSTPDFLAVQAVSIAFSLVALILAIIGFRQLWLYGARGGKACIHTLALIALPLGIFAFLLSQHFMSPRLYDVASDIDDVPQFINPPKTDQKWLTRSDIISAEMRQEQRTAYPEFAGHRYEGAIDRLYTAVRKVARANKITVTAISGMPGAEPDRAAPKQLDEVKEQAEAFEFAPDELPTNVPVPSIRPRVPNAPVQGLAAGEVEASPDDMVIIQGAMSNYIIGLPYHLVIRLKEEGQTTLVDIRMVADYGHNDFGLGLNMAKSFLKALDAEMLGLNDT